MCPPSIQPRPCQRNGDRDGGGNGNGNGNGCLVQWLVDDDPMDLAAREVSPSRNGVLSALLAFSIDA